MFVPIKNARPARRPPRPSQLQSLSLAPSNVWPVSAGHRNVGLKTAFGQAVDVTFGYRRARTIVALDAQLAHRRRGMRVEADHEALVLEAHSGQRVAQHSLRDHPEPVSDGCRVRRPPVLSMPPPPPSTVVPCRLGE